MRIIIATVLVCGALAWAAEPKKSEEPRGKRNLQYSIAHHYNSQPSYRLERRISTGSQIPQLYHSQFFPGPIRPYSPFHKDGPHDDLLTDNNHLSEHHHYPKHQVIERPVYIKEPEPIIEIIIKESNVTLPPPPAPPTPPPKKKEQVQVFYVKYKKNPNGHGKDSVIYEKPVAAISPPIGDEHDEEPVEEYHHHHEVVTSPPPPSTTLRTVIKPDSETYHSPSGIKVTFGKEGFDYDKRSNKEEDLKAAGVDHRTVQFPQGRQLSSFPPSFPRSRPPTNFNYSPAFRSEPPRQPQAYRPFSQPVPQFRPSHHHFARQSPQIPSSQQYSTLPKFPPFNPKPNNTPQFSPSRPAPPQFHQQSTGPRQPVAYQPFENLRTQPPPVQFRPQTHFPINQHPPLEQKPVVFNQFTHQPSNQQEAINQQRHQQEQEKQQDNRYQQPQIPPQQQQQQHIPYQTIRQQEQQIPHQSIPQQQQQISHQSIPQQPQHVPQQQQQHILNHQQQRIPQQQPSPQQQHIPQQQNIPHQPPHQQHPQDHHSFIPPGGELIQSLPKYEQHISVLEPNQNQHPQALALQQFQQLQAAQPTIKTPPSENHLSQSEYNEKIQQQFREANALQESIRQTNPQQQYFELQQSRSPVVPSNYQTTARPSYSTTTTTAATTTTTTTQEPEKPSTTTKDPTVLNAQLPDEVPDDLREQLLSSGILNNADISILDYDKVGDIPLSALPPDQLANFYSAGGAQQIAAAGSEPVPSIVNADGSAVDSYDEEAEASEVQEVRAKPEVQMKVVHYDPQTERGQQVQESYVKEDATQVDPVVLNDEKYNRYLPLKVSGAQFPIPDVPELKGKRISSVVVLAPVTYDFSSARKTRDVKKGTDETDLIQGDALKALLKSPTLENYKKFLDSENKTRNDKQAVILLVTGPSEDTKEKEIYMYDVATQTVSKLSGELSAAFVEAAEANASEDPEEAAASTIVETRVPYTDNFTPSDEEFEGAPSDFSESKIPIIDPMQGDLETEASEHLESFVDISGMPVDEDDLTAAASNSVHEERSQS